MQEKKSPFKSKMMVINVLSIIGVVAAMAAEEIGKGTGTAVIVVNAVNIILRYFTSQPIK